MNPAPLQRQAVRRVLNAGCGEDLYGTDRLDLHETKATTKVCNMELGLPYEDATFDEILSQCSIEHMRNPGGPDGGVRPRDEARRPAHGGN
ncbi:MAG: hypothetical protein HY296_01690 [Thaumarchaeota archaeon]|nr:hypothetical protein [Nitrososphaerota archaeon]